MLSICLLDMEGHCLITIIMIYFPLSVPSLPPPVPSLVCRGWKAGRIRTSACCCTGAGQDNGDSLISVGIHVWGLYCDYMPNGISQSPRASPLGLALSLIGWISDTRSQGNLAFWPSLLRHSPRYMAEWCLVGSRVCSRRSICEKCTCGCTAVFSARSALQQKLHQLQILTPDVIIPLSPVHCFAGE